MEEQANTGYFDPYIVPREYIETAAAQIGKTNTQANEYAYMLRLAKDWEDAGLEPVFIYQPMYGTYTMTSQEAIDGKYH